MRVGYCATFQNPGLWDSDRALYERELRLAELAEPLGFDSVWSTEHHVTGYQMGPDVLQFLSYMAGRTTRVDLGSMVVVLPWHDTYRVAAQASLVDHYSGGRLLLGIGRGAGRREFESLRVPMGESRERFKEQADMLLRGLEQGYVEYDGRYVKQPRTDLRPAPFKSFRGRTYAAAVSPESVRIMAELGVGILVIPQKPWEDVERELGEYREIYRSANGSEPPPPVVAGWTFCDEDAGRAEEEATRYMGRYWRTVLDHYEIGKEHFANTKGYEFYGKMSENVATQGADAAVEFFKSLQVWGTPEQCLEKIQDIRARTGAETFVGVFSYVDMPEEEAERNLRLFARAVMPELQKLAPRA